MQHLAVIMDGNRRWAKQRSLEDAEGHLKGKDAAKVAVEFCIKNSIKYLSLYTFSAENFRRSEREKNYIFNALLEAIDGELDEFIKEEVRINFIGDRLLFPKHLMPAINRAEEKTKEFSRLTLNILFCYGGKQELVHAMKQIADQVKTGTLDINHINEDTISRALWTAGIPDPDLIVRTGGDSRLSNFLTYQSTYTELMFVDRFWPEMTEDDFKQCIKHYKDVRPNFGH